MLDAILALGSAIIGAAATFAFRQWHSERERREVLLKRYLAQLQGACESLWFRIRNLSYEGVPGASEAEYLQTTTMYALGRALGIEQMLALEGLYPEVKKRFSSLESALVPRVIDDAVRAATKNAGKELQQYDRLALGEATVERDGDELHQVTFLEFRRLVESERSEKKWWRPSRTSAAKLEYAGDRAKPLMCATKRLALALSDVTAMDSALVDTSARCCADEATRCRQPGCEKPLRRLFRFSNSGRAAWGLKIRIVRRDRT